MEKPARYAGPEYGAHRPDPSADVSLVLAFPDVYEVGCSNLGLTILYRLIQQLGWVRVERVFAPWPDYGDALVRSSLPLGTRESGASLAGFDVLGFSLQHELTYTTVLWMLDLARLPLLSADRDARHPLVIAGGPCATNPEPLSAFVDAFTPGDGEQILVQVLELVKDARRHGASRQDLLAALARTGHVFVPSLYGRLSTRTGRCVPVAPPSGHPPWPVRLAPPAGLLGAAPLPVVPSVETVFDRFQVEIARGCAGGCRFCHAGVIYRPVRERSPGSVVREAVRGALLTGYDEVSLASLSTADYPALLQVTGALGPVLDQRRIALSVASLRAYGLPAAALEAIRRVRATGMTLAPEAGTDRLRTVINKSVTPGDLLDALARMRDLGWQKAKLYFMFGLPTETDADLEGIAGLVAEAVRTFGSRGRRRLSVSVSGFVPKPFTPFEREAFAGVDELRARAHRIRELFKDCPVQLSFHDHRQRLVEALLARGGAEMGDALLCAYRGGCRFDGWSEMFRQAAWDAALAGAGVDVPAQCAEIEDGAPLPWDGIETHVSPAHLASERELARASKASSRCDAPWGERCESCGAPCDPSNAALFHGDDTRAGLGEALEAIVLHLESAREAFDLDSGAKERLFMLLGFDRTGKAAWLGHRDTLRIIGQSLRRAAVPLRYSQGYTPRPGMVFCAAMPVGVAGLGELLRVEVTAPLRSERALLDRLEQTTPEGIDFSFARMLDPREARALARGPRSMGLAFLLGPGTDPREVERVVKELHMAGAMPVVRSDRGRNVTLDLLGMIDGVEVRRVADVTWLAGRVPEMHALAVTLITRPLDGRWPRPSELRAVLAGYGVEVEWMVRTLHAEVGA